MTKRISAVLTPLAPAFAVLIWLAMVLLLEARDAGPDAELDLFGGATSRGAVIGLVIAALYLPLALARRTTHLAGAMGWTFVLMALSAAVVSLYWSSLDPDGQTDQAYRVGRWAIAAGGALGAMIFLWPRAGWFARLAAPLTLAVAYGEVAPRIFYLDSFFYRPDEAPQAQVETEELYHRQPQLLADQIAGLLPQTPGKPEVYGLVLGGTAHEDVFLSEVEKVSEILAETYGAAGRILKLANSSVDPFRLPMASRRNLSAALLALGAAKGPEDLAFLYLASHGADDILALTFWEAATRDLSAAEFAGMLDQARLGTAVIVVSACYSGSFIDDLRAADRLVITAARADRPSFGCANGREWTEFGESFFVKGLSQTKDPIAAFEIARSDIWWKELKGLRAGSYPQIDAGAEMASRLVPFVTRDLATLAAP